MKLLRSILIAGLALAVLSTPAWAVTFQVTADTAGSPVTNKITKAAGTATTLPVSAKSSAFISFDVGSSGIDANAVTAARLVIFFPRVTKPGNLALFVNGSSFTETFTPPTTSIPLPTTGAIIEIPIPVTTADTKHFRTFIVTQAVKDWLSGATADNGFGIGADLSTSTVNVLIGSKEGSGSGYPAVLEVDVNDGATGTVAGSSATFSNSVIVNNANDDNGTVTSGLTFGGADGEGIASDRVGTSAKPNKFGLDLYTNFAQRLSITQAGNVGIGTTTPGALLEVNGTAKFDSTATFSGPITQNLSGGNFSFISSNGTAAGNAQLNFGIGSAPNNFGIIDNTNGPIQFETGGSSRITILANGNVNIGSNGGTGNLNVNSSGVTGVASVLRNVSGGGGSVITQEYQTSGGTTYAQFQDPIISGASLFLFNGVGAQPGGGSWSNSSDRRLKKNIEPLSGALDRLMQLRSVTYEYRDPAAIHELSGTQIGFIAQEVEPIFPNWVGEKADGMKFLAIKGFESLTVQALRELRSEKDAQIEKLRAENTALAEKVAALEARDQARVALDAELKARLTRLESALDASPARPVRAALDFK